jgi:hypothetical protein
VTESGVKLGRCPTELFFKKSLLDFEENILIVHLITCKKYYELDRKFRWNIGYPGWPQGWACSGRFRSGHFRRSGRFRCSGRLH